MNRRLAGVAALWVGVALIIIVGTAAHHMSYPATALSLVLVACTATLVVALAWATRVVVTSIALFHDDVDVELLEPTGRIDHMLTRWRDAARNRASSAGG